MTDWPLTGTFWKLIEFIVGDSITPVLKGTVVTVQFGRSDLAGSGGCNAYCATYLLKMPSQIAIGNLAHTKKFCATPRGIMEQEEQFFDHLRSTTSFEIGADDKLVLSADEKELGLRFERLQSATI